MKTWYLPTLKGRWLLAFRILWCATFALAVVSQIADDLKIPREVRSRVQFERLGLMSGWGEWGVRPFGEAARAGVRDTDKIIAIDRHMLGAAATRTDEAVMRALDMADGTLVQLTFASRDGGKPRDVTLARDDRAVRQAFGSGIPPHTADLITELAEGVAGAVNVLVGLLLFRSRARDPVVAILSYYAILGCVDLDLVAPGAPTWLDAGRVVLDVALLEFGFIFFPDGRAHGIVSRAAMLCALANLALIIPGAGPGPWRTLNDVVAVATLALITLALVQRSRTTQSLQIRLQIRWIWLGFAVLAIAFALSALFDYLWSNEVFPGPVGSMWTLLLASLAGTLGNLGLFLGMLVSLLRYRLYDAEAIVSRSAAYGALVLFLGAIFAASEKFIEVLGEDYLGHRNAALSAGLGAAVAAMMIAPLHRRMHHWAEHRFQRALVHLRHGLPLLVGDLRETATLDQLAQETLERVTTGLRAVHGAIVIDGAALETRGIDAEAVRFWLAGWTPPHDRDRLDCDRADPLMPVRLPLHAEDMRRVGWLLLGPRPDGSFYGRDERETLADLADPIARALAVAHRREARESERRRDFGDLRQLVTLLHERLARLEERSLPRSAGVP